ncbi:MAG TPA: FG-GAP-like repeat-containing protein [Thermoanaerobaculia bacterium]|nr:FG-GAP-like repeat-containing protein [Thermoanaerobaculia bacterium]
MKPLRLLLSLIPLLPIALHAETQSLDAFPLHSRLTGTPELTWVADFTRDGRNDVLVASATSVAVLPGIGNAAFGAPLSTAMTNLRAEGVADFNNDGAPDLYFSLREGDGFAVMPGLGNGRFGAPAIVNGGGDLLIAGRFDADELPDMAVIANTRPATISVFPSDGAGGFQSPTMTSFSFLDASDAATGDFDADGRVDVALTGRFASWILWNDGGSRFTATELESGDAIAAGDFDADGASDVIVANDVSDVSRVSFGTKGARSSFGSTNVLVPAGDPSSMHAADFDQDGRTDVAMFSTATISMLTPRAGRTFPPPVSHLAGPPPQTTSIGDVDGDGDVDVVFTNERETDVVSWIPGVGDGTLRAHRAIDTRRATGAFFPDGLEEFESFDVDGDGRRDLVIQDWRERRLSVLRADGAGGFHPVVHTPTEQDGFDNVNYLPAGDLDGDGRGDVILTYPQNGGPPFTSSVFHGRSDGSFRRGAALGDVGIAGIVDLNGDGDADLLEFDGDLHPGNGNGTFGTPIRTALTRLDGVHFADVDDNGLTDVLSSRGNDLQTFLNEGELKFSDARKTWSYEIVAIGDLTGDGVADVLVDRSIMHVQRGLADGTFADVRPFATIPTLGGAAAIADLDGDGHNDVARGAQILFGNGDGSFRDAGGYRGAADESSYFLVGVTEGDGDSSPALLVRTGNIVAFIPAGAPARGTQIATVALESSRNPAEYGVGATLKARVTNDATAAKPAGVVRFEVDGRAAALIEIGADGTASLGLGFEVGTATVRATYTGNEEFAERSATLVQQTTKAATITTIETYRLSGATPVPATTFESGDTIQIEARAIPASRFGALSGPITIRLGSVVLGTLANPNQRLRISTPSMLAAGTHELTAEWPGNENYLASSATVTIAVQARPSPPRRRGVRH